MENSLLGAILEPLLESWEKVGDLTPKMFQLVVIVIAGFLLAWILKILFRYLLTAIRFDSFGHRIGLGSLLTKANINQTPSVAISLLVYWLVVFVFLTIGLNALNVTAVDKMVTAFFAYIPHLLVALMVFILGYFLSQFLSRAMLIGLVNAHIKSARLIAAVFQILILIFFLAMAIEQLGIARGVVVATFSIGFGGMILALAIAFGLGGKDIAKEILERRFKSAKEKEKSEANDISHI